jgi:Holliday junction resolvasome RuvABC DNA-binding subunit
MFGADFMDAKRRVAAGAHTRAAAAEHRLAAAKEHARDVMTGLRELGFRADEARRAAAYSETLQDATLEERMRLALVFLCPKPRVENRVGPCIGAST